MFTLEQQLAAWAEWAAISAGLNFLLLKWFSGGHNEADEDTEIECHQFVIDALCDAEKMRTIEAITGKNLREQLAVGEAIALHEIVNLLKMGAKRN